MDWKSSSFNESQESSDYAIGSNIKTKIFTNPSRLTVIIFNNILHRIIRLTELTKRLFLIMFTSCSSNYNSSFIHRCRRSRDGWNIPPARSPNNQPLNIIVNVFLVFWKFSCDHLANGVGMCDHWSNTWTRLWLNFSWCNLIIMCTSSYHDNNSRCLKVRILSG